jgi:predicted RNA-binding Zn-ribbon protein involved in translation (DUF1610 family)
LKGKKSRVRYVSCISCGYKVKRGLLKIGSPFEVNGNLTQWSCPKCGTSLRIYDEDGQTFFHRPMSMSLAIEIPNGTLVVAGSEEIK